jgi:hypothetical protein
MSIRIIREGYADELNRRYFAHRHEDGGYSLVASADSAWIDRLLCREWWEEITAQQWLAFQRANDNLGTKSD